MLETNYDLNSLLINFALFLLQLSIFILVIVILVINRRYLKEYYKMGLILAIVCLALSLPLHISSFFSLDMSLFFLNSPESRDGNIYGLFADFAKTLYIIFSLIGLVLAAVYKTLAYPAAVGEWKVVHERPFPILMGAQNKQLGRIAIAAGIGALLAVASAFAFKIIRVGPNELLERQWQIFMNIDYLPSFVQIIFLIFFVIEAAIAEEIIFRGVLLGFLVRKSKGKILPLLISIFAISLVWAFLHYFNTNTPLIKISQVFILGVILAEFSRRWSLESAIVMHASLNVFAVLISLIPWFSGV